MAAFDREKALENALAQIERAHGKGSVMRLGDEVRSPIEVIPTGSIALDVALGIGGLPRGRIVEIYGPESSGKTTPAMLCTPPWFTAGILCQKSLLSVPSICQLSWLARVPFTEPKPPTEYPP